jgi:2-polyprenyl-3-methyl-5-hydroxy-6-metoxy-1,4-benzoquinol methylase
MGHFLAQRKREPEWMDAPDADPAVLERSLRFIRRVNSFLGYTRATLHHLRRLTRGWPAGKTIRILDVATGSGDIPMAILHWADRWNLPVRIIAVDLHEATLRTAASLGREARLRFVRADATRLPFDDAAFDFVLTGMFLHHLDEALAVGVLREMDRVAARGLIAADLLRSRRAYAWIWLFTLLSNPMVKHDARVSVSGAFNAAELLRLRDAAGLEYLQPHRHFGHRLVLAGRKVAE